jgi:hypothetical protein
LKETFITSAQNSFHVNWILVEYDLSSDQISIGLALRLTLLLSRADDNCCRNNNYLAGACGLTYITEYFKKFLGDFDVK